MNATRTRRSPQDDSVPQAPETTPTFGGSAHDHSFTLQAIMELKGSVGGMTEAINGLRESINLAVAAAAKTEERLNAKLSKIDGEVVSLAKDHHAAKWVLSVSAVFAIAVLGAAGWVANEVWSFAKPVIKEKIEAPGRPTAAAPAVAPAFENPYAVPSPAQQGSRGAPAAKRASGG